MNIYKATKRIKGNAVTRGQWKIISGKEGLSDYSKNDQRDDQRIKSD